MYLLLNIFIPNTLFRNSSSVLLGGPLDIPHENPFTGQSTPHRRLNSARSTKIFLYAGIFINRAVGTVHLGRFNERLDVFMLLQPFTIPSWRRLRGLLVSAGSYLLRIYSPVNYCHCAPYYAGVLCPWIGGLRWIKILSPFRQKPARGTVWSLNTVIQNLNRAVVTNLRFTCAILFKYNTGRVCSG